MTSEVAVLLLAMAETEGMVTSMTYRQTYRACKQGVAYVAKAVSLRSPGSSLLINCCSLRCSDAAVHLTSSALSVSSLVPRPHSLREGRSGASK